MKSGWGSTGTLPNSRRRSDRFLRYVVLPIVPTEDCQQVFKNYDVIVDEKVICAGMPLRGTCSGNYLNVGFF